MYYFWATVHGYTSYTFFLKFSPTSIVDALFNLLIFDILLIFIILGLFFGRINKADDCVGELVCEMHVNLELRIRIYMNIIGWI